MLDLALEVRKHLGNSILEDAGKRLLKFKKPSKTLEWEMMRLALADPITGPTASEQGVLGIWADQSLSGDLLLLTTVGLLCKSTGAQIGGLL